MNAITIEPRFDPGRARTILTPMPQRIVVPPSVFWILRQYGRFHTLFHFEADTDDAACSTRANSPLFKSPFFVPNYHLSHVDANGIVCFANTNYIHNGLDPVDAFWMSGFNVLPNWAARRPIAYAPRKAGGCVITNWNEHKVIVQRMIGGNSVFVNREGNPLF